jgi:hypothetical protein
MGAPPPPIKGKIVVAHVFDKGKQFLYTPKKTREEWGR